MKSQALKKMLNAVSAVLVFFIASCTGSWNIFDENAYGIVDPYAEENSLENVITDQYIQPREYAIGDNIYENIYNPAQSMPGTSREENITDSTELSFFDLSAPCNSAQDEYRFFREQQRTEEQCTSQQYIEPQSNIDENVFDKGGSMVEMSDHRDGTVDGIDDYSEWFVPNKNGGYIHDPIELTDTQGNVHSSSPHIIEENNEDGASSTSTRKNNRGKTVRAKKRTVEKRKVSNIDGPSSQPVAKRKKKESIKKNKSQAAINTEKESNRMATFNIGLWNNVRLTNAQRANCKIYHHTIYKYYKYLEFYKYLNYEIESDLYQEKMKKEIKSFSAGIASLIKQNALWYFIACRTTNVNTKHKDLLWLRNLFADKEESEHKTMLMNLEGFYPEVAAEMLAYMERHKPLRVIKKYPPIKWNETLGDVYMRKSLDLNYEMMKYQDRICKMHEKYSALAYALRMVLALPEVYQDFSKISAKFIKATLISDNICKNKQTHQVLLSIHALVKAENNDKKIENENEYESIHSALESIYEKKYKKSQKSPSCTRIYT
ncbi:hypothetical protein NEMIN01_2261 [Nematocida minor]|uniref:uncharacterized protein n=1 Tax=Nematocida minor TaxID=1912983 RepID=UPI0022211F10|nr:uncharacterized protein NEMIN01_2261 [Nematocida minor]KAI5192881.1 hypothetical protein NEMIN01_2261 [Nematocida minor]